MQRLLQAAVNTAMMISGISFPLLTEVLILFAHGGNIIHLGKKKNKEKEEYPNISSAD